MIKRFIARVVRVFFLRGFATFCVCWTLVVSFAAFFPHLKPEGFFWYLAIIALSIAHGLWSCWPKSQIEFEIPATDSVFKIKFGNIFDGNDLVVVPANEYFDGLLGDHVSVTSIHGQLIKELLDGKSDTFISSVNTALATAHIKGTKVQRQSGQCTKYPIGTVACITISGRRYLIAALTRIDLNSLKASATLDDLTRCLAGIWEGARNNSHGNTIKLPLIGSGLSGVGLPPKCLIDLIVVSFVYATKQQKVADKAVLVLPPRLKWAVDLNSFKRNWT